jgi:putative ABC transport system permease protein
MGMMLRRWCDAIALDARDAVRSLRASPMTTLGVVMTLAMGIGALAVMYGLMSALLLRLPEHVAEPERVRRLFFHYDQPGAPRDTGATWTACVVDRLRAEASTVEHAAAYTRFEISIGAGADAARARATVVSAGFWTVVGTRPAIGRLLADDEAQPVTGPRVAILGHAFWQQRYGGAADVVGRTLRIRGEPFEIIGVTPPRFRGIGPDDVDLWLPLSAYTLSGRAWELDTTLSHVVRLKRGVSTALADADLSRVVAGFADQDAGCERRTTAARLSVTAGPLTGGLGSDMLLTSDARVTIWLVGVAAALLIVACANVAGVLLLRAFRRRRDIAVRLALGMSRRRLAMQLLVESTLLAALGGAAAFAVVVWAGAWLRRRLMPQLSAELGAVDPSLLALIAACVIGAACFAGLAPALHAATGPLDALQGGAARTTSRRGRLHSLLLVSQIAVSMVLLTGAGLFLRSLHNVRGLDLGLDPDNVLVATVDFAGTGRSPRDVSAFYERALEGVRHLPGVEGASLARSIPLRSARAGSIRPMGRTDPITAPGGDVTYVNHVTPGFFATTGTRIVEGRDFLPHERDASVVVVNEALAQMGWPGRSPVGECVEVDDRGACAIVVGVVENARRFFLREPPALLFYRPLARDEDDRAPSLFIRVASDERRIAAAVTRTMQGLEPDLPFIRFQTLADALDPQVRPWQLGMSVFTVLSSIAVLLAGVGLYGALSYAVTQRTREMGVRVALGATAADVTRLVVGDGLRLALAGVVVGLAVSLAAGPWIGGLLFEVSPRDPAVFAIVTALLLAVTLLAAFVPSRQATRVDPVVALRAS